jgi:serine/threonine protein phosphatase PrpC
LKKTANNVTGENNVPSCVHGGTTATVVIILDGRRLIVANVGDSTALMLGLPTDSHKMLPIDSWTPSIVKDSNRFILGREGAVPAPSLICRMGAVDGAAATSMCTASDPMPMPAIVPRASTSARSHPPLELSADHSPENYSEYVRITAFRPSPQPSVHPKPELLFLYDALSTTKSSCPSIFPDSSQGVKSGHGSYYKNVRCEWATLVSTPAHAHFQDALAFTRSLGDLHLQTYGVSHIPEIKWMDIVGKQNDVEIPLVNHPFALVVASDGVWDNWRYEDVSNFMLEQRLLDSVATSGSALQPVVELMNTNLERGRANFGSSADNMTAITLTFHPHTSS